MKPATILDVGSSKVVCLCGSMVDKDGIVVHGAGISTYAGFRDGAFLDKQSLHNAVVDCVHKTEQESRIRIREQNGPLRLTNGSFAAMIRNRTYRERRYAMLLSQVSQNTWTLSFDGVPYIVHTPQAPFAMALRR